MKKKFIDSIRVADPCHESWDEMTGNDRVRFCSHCAKDVNNISEMTRRDAKRLVRRSGGSLCIRYAEHPETKAPLFAKQLTQITRRRVPLMAAGVMSASLSLASLTYAQGDARPRPAVAATAGCFDAGANKPDPSCKSSGSIRGKVFDPKGAPASRISVSVLDKDGNKVRTTTSDDAGEFTFPDVVNGSYSIRTDAGNGFASRTISDVVVNEVESSVRIDLPAELTIVSGYAMVLPRTVTVLPMLPVSDDLTEARDMLARGEDVNQKDEDGETPLFAAVEDANLELVKFLLDHGAKVNVRNNQKETPLMMIDDETPIEIVELLVQRGARVDRQAQNGETVLIRAADERAKPEVLTALIRAGADLNLQDKEGKTALMAAADHNDLENMRRLVEAGADVNLRDADGDNAWDYATEKEAEDLLVSYGVILDPEDLEHVHEDPSSDYEKPTAPEP